MKKLKKHLGSWLNRLANKDIRIEHGQLEVVDETPQEQQKHRVRDFVTVNTFLTLLLVVVAWAIAGFYMPKIRLGDSLVSARQTDAALRSRIDEFKDTYKLAVVYPDGTKKDFSLRDMGLEIDAASTINSIRDRQHKFVSRLKWWQPTIAYLTVNTTTQTDVFVDQQATITVQPAKDAVLSIKDGTVQLANSITGKHYGLEEPATTLINTVSKMQSATLQLQILSTRPAITAKHLAQYQTRLKQMLSQEVIFIINNRKTQASAADIAEWIELTSSESSKKLDITVNSGKVLDYINKISASSVRPPIAQVEGVQSNGNPAVLVKGVNGTDVANKSEASVEAAQNLLQGKGTQTTLSIGYAPYNTVSAQTYGKWIEIDTTRKRMYAYEQNRLVRTFLISAGAPETPTVTGRFAIYAKVAQQDMRGLNVDGSRYYQPNVSWVSYFYADYAIHGNYWRPLSYFGKTNSSHGCVGIINSDAQWIYSWAPIGTPVIAHI